MSTPEPDLPPPSPPAMPSPPAGMPGRVAAAIIGLHALGCVLAVVFALMAPQDASLSTGSQLMFSVFTLLFAIGLGLVARGLWRGATWPRTAALVWLALLLPVGWAVVQARALIGAILVGSALLGFVAVAAESRRAART